MVAMTGKDCVAIASDRRFGVQAMTLSTDFQKLFGIVPGRLYLGLAGLGTDVQTLAQSLTYKTGMFRMQEDRDIGARSFAHLVSSTLYEKRFGPYYAEPCIAGLDVNPVTKQLEPFVCSMDLIGCINFAKDFVVCGTSSANLYGMCESLWEPGLEPEDLFETISQALMNAVDRDALSGWGATVHVITKQGVTTRTLKARMD